MFRINFTIRHILKVSPLKYILIVKIGLVWDAGVKGPVDSGCRNNVGMPPDSGSPPIRQLVPHYLSIQFTFTF